MSATSSREEVTASFVATVRSDKPLAVKQAAWWHFEIAMWYHAYLGGLALKAMDSKIAEAVYALILARKAG